jgi:phosphoenolpyruvate carboxykinase (diphosphate)
MLKFSTGAAKRSTFSHKMHTSIQGLNSMAEQSTVPSPKLIQYINLKLAALGCPTCETGDNSQFEEMSSLLAHQHEINRLLADYLCPADKRIQSFLYNFLEDAPLVKLPTRTFVLDRYGLARVLSLPPVRPFFASEIVNSYRVRQGVLHNPKSDRRTTEGIFHIAEGGLPVPDDKVCVPKRVAGRLLQLAFAPPAELLRLPFTSAQEKQAECFVSLLLRPTVCPEVPGFTPDKSMEIRFLAPGGLVSNLDFVESIFGNAGNPYLPENDAGLDPEHWTGHTGCVILAPHLTKFTKKELGLPHWENASERQRRDRVCWNDEGELYNNGVAFKLSCRDESGVIVTVIADNYFGYCKKEVKTQLSYSANLFGLCEEEHAGGALVFPSHDLGEEFRPDRVAAQLDYRFDEMVSSYAELIDVRPEGYAVDKHFPDILYVPENARFDLHKQLVSWVRNGTERKLKLLPHQTYIRPSGYKIEMIKPAGGRAWRLVGTAAEGTLCHKPSTVSGGGKSEISKPISDAIIQGPVFVADFKKDFDRVEDLINRNYAGRFRDGRKSRSSRLILSPDRSLGSVIKLLTPAPDLYSDEYSRWLDSVPQYQRELVFVVKRFYNPDWSENWREHFSVDIINGVPGHELKCDNRRLVTNYLRVGYDQDGAWRTFGLRKDFYPASKLAVEDDITVSIAVPSGSLENLNPEYQHQSVKFVKNCEERLFQRPDDAIHPGYDKQTEMHFAAPGNFFSNYQPLTPSDAREIIEDAIGFDKFTLPMQQLIREATVPGNGTYFVSSAHPRVVGGKPSKNPRYLQLRPDLANPRDAHLGEIGVRLRRRVPLGKPIHKPVNAVLPGRRNNPPEGELRPLAVFNPIHYLELPELFMEFICSVTGKSPSTTGAGSEGALTKGPFNSLLPIIDLNAALVSYLLTGDAVFITATGYVGPYFRVDHDISLLIPEIWSRMSVTERDPRYLISEGYLERCIDFEYNGRVIPASRLGYRITMQFVLAFFGQMFNHPATLFTEEMLRPELQDKEIFVDGLDNIISTQKRVARLYFNDGSINLACPPMRALLHIMLQDEFEGKGLDDPEIRALFTRENMLASDWYAERLKARQTADVSLWDRHVHYLKAFVGKANYAEEATRLGISDRLSYALKTLQMVRSPDYLEHLRGTIGAQPLPTA